jgi:hypothetical protein
MIRLNPINRRKGLIAGMVGGMVGAFAMRTYWMLLAPDAFRQIPNRHKPVQVAQKLPEIAPVVHPQRSYGEAATSVVGRAIYENVLGREVESSAEQRHLRDAVLFAWGTLMGAAYGATRTTDRWRDIAGGFFFGIRLFVGDEIAAAGLGLRPDPRSWSRREHLVWLTGHWVYSFVTAQVTRVLYRLL